MKTKTKKAWGGRFEKASHPLLERFNASLSFDRRLFAEDIDGSLAHAAMLQKIGVLSATELKSIQKGLDEVKKEIESGQFVFSDALEDIHMAVETRLTQKIGALGGKLHTARSRNDQVALDLRLFCKRQIQQITAKILKLQGAFVALAEKEGFVAMPGYTHLQRAQPIYWAHHLLAYFEMLERDRARFESSLERNDFSPLGSGALAGTTFPVDREFVAKQLGFKGATQNSLDSVSDRDLAAEILFNASLMMVHLSRLAEELILWSSQEFNFVKLPQEFCTGSSMMPQKINPDVPELIRGKSGRVFGNLVALLTVMKGLPLAYNKDMQEDKEPLFDTLTTLHDVLDILNELIPGLKPNANAMQKATETGFILATDLADYLADKGVPFRDAHEVVGSLIRYCIEQNKTLESLTPSEFKRFSPAIGGDVSAWLSNEASMNRRKSTGGTARKEVEKQIKRAKKLLM